MEAATGNPELATVGQANAKLDAAVASAINALSELSLNPVANAAMLQGKHLELRESISTYGPKAATDKLARAGRVLGQIINGEVACLEGIDPGVNQPRIEELKEEQAAVAKHIESISADMEKCTLSDDILAEVRRVCAADKRLVPGARVWLWGLASEALRNGQIGKLVKYMEDRGRWQVEVTDLLKTCYQKVAIKAENLAFFSEPFDDDNAELGVINYDAIEIMHRAMGHIYQQIADDIHYSHAASAEAGVVGQWHANLNANDPEWEGTFLRLRDRHINAPTRDTGFELGNHIYTSLSVAFAKDTHVTFAEDAGFVLDGLPKLVCEKAMHIAQIWIIKLLGAYSHFLPVMAAHEHPDALRQQVQRRDLDLDPAVSDSGELVDASDAVSVSSCMSGVAAMGLRDQRPDGRQPVRGDFRDLPPETWPGHKTVVDDNGVKITMPNNVSIDPRSTRSYKPSSTRSADSEVAKINEAAERGRGSSKKKKKEKKPKEKAAKDHGAWFTKTCDVPGINPATGKQDIEGTVRIPPEVMQYVDPALLGMETADELLLFASMLERMPEDHEHRSHIQSLHDMFAQGQVRGVPQPGDMPTGLGSIRTSMKLRLGPPSHGGEYDPTFAGVQLELNQLAKRCGLADWAENVLRMDKVVEETPGRHGIIMVYFSMPMHVRKYVEGHI